MRKELETQTRVSNETLSRSTSKFIKLSVLGQRKKQLKRIKTIGVHMTEILVGTTSSILPPTTRPTAAVD